MLKHFNLILIFSLIYSSCFSMEGTSTYLIRFCSEVTCEIGVKSGYVNNSGDTIISNEKYHYCYTDTIRTFGFVLKKKGGCFAINNLGVEQYEVYWFDMGPDPISDGLFRIIKNDKIGYADSIGKIVIEPKYGCAEPFFDGKARVTNNCTLQRDNFEHNVMISDSWFYIDKFGNVIK